MFLRSTRRLWEFGAAAVVALWLLAPVEALPNHWNTGVGDAPGFQGTPIPGPTQTPPRPTPVRTPPFSGTIFIDPDILTGEDPSSFERATYTGRGMRRVYDRRVADWVTVEAYLFDLHFDDGLTSEAQVNPEFGSQEAAEALALRYAEELGRLPAALRRDVDALWIHAGTELFGGGNRSILIHTGQSDAYVRDGILEETLIHEAAHTSLDADHARSEGWLEAQALDGNFISTYARDNPLREDVAESFVPYLAERYRRDRISEDLAAVILATIPNRMDYLDRQDLDLYPMVQGKTWNDLFLPYLDRGEIRR